MKFAPGQMVALAQCKMGAEVRKHVKVGQRGTVVCFAGIWLFDDIHRAWYEVDFDGYRCNCEIAALVPVEPDEGRQVSRWDASIWMPLEIAIRAPYRGGK